MVFHYYSISVTKDFRGQTETVLYMHKKKPYSPVTGKYQQKTIDYRSICEAITDSYLADLIVKPAICCPQYFVKKVKFRG